MRALAGAIAATNAFRQAQVAGDPDLAAYQSNCRAAQAALRRSEVMFTAEVLNVEGSNLDNS
jgi:hypothetical protein